MGKFKVGDRIKLKDNSSGYLNGFNIGDICEIFEIDDNCVILPYHIRKDLFTGWCDEDMIEFVEENKNISSTITVNCNGIIVSKIDNQIEREGNNMNKVLELYAKRKREEIEKELEEKIIKDYNCLQLVAEYNQIVAEFEEKMDNLYKNELNFGESTIETGYYTSGYKYRIKENDIKENIRDIYHVETAEKFKELEDLVEEVSAQLSLSNDLEYQKDILVKYDIIDKKTGKIK